MTQKQQNYRWNFIVNLVDGATFWFGFGFISSTTILPLFISKLTTSLLPIGLVSVIASAGWFLPQLFSARITEGIPKMKRIAIGWGIFLERLPIWMMTLSAFIAGRSPTLALVIFLICYTWYSVGSGIVAPSWMGLIAKIFTPEKRGSFLGTTMFIGAGTGALGSLVSAWLLEAWDFPKSFIALFGIAALFITISWIFLALTREPAGEVVPDSQDWHSYWKDLLRILREDQNYRRYVLSTVIITVGAMGTGFITISAIQQFQISDASVGLYTLTMLISQTVGNLVLGWMADRFGHKLSVEIGVFAMLIAFLIAMFMPDPSLYFVVYALLGINIASGVVSGMMVVWEFCELPRVPTYAGLANTTRGLFGLIAPLIATQLANFSYGLLFGICALLTLLGWAMLKFWVVEPRWRREKTNK